MMMGSSLLGSVIGLKCPTESSETLAGGFGPTLTASSDQSPIQPKPRHFSTTSSNPSSTSCSTSTTANMCIQTPHVLPLTPPTPTPSRSPSPTSQVGCEIPPKSRKNSSSAPTTPCSHLGVVRGYKKIKIQTKLGRSDEDHVLLTSDSDSELIRKRSRIVPTKKVKSTITPSPSNLSEDDHTENFTSTTFNSSRTDSSNDLWPEECLKNTIPLPEMQDMDRERDLTRLGLDDLRETYLKTLDHSRKSPSSSLQVTTSSIKSTTDNDENAANSGTTNIQLPITPISPEGFTSSSQSTSRNEPMHSSKSPHPLDGSTPFNLTLKDKDGDLKVSLRIPPFKSWRKRMSPTDDSKISEQSPKKRLTIDVSAQKSPSPERSDSGISICSDSSNGEDKGKQVSQRRRTSGKPLIASRWTEEADSQVSDYGLVMRCFYLYMFSPHSGKCKSSVSASGTECLVPSQSTFAPVCSPDRRTIAVVSEAGFNSVRFETLQNLLTSSTQNHCKKITLDMMGKLCRVPQSVPCHCVKVELNLNDDGPELTPSQTFENLSIFETATRRTVECTTTVYSFGSKVLETAQLTSSTKQEGRHFYYFDFVNAFFDSFLKGARGMLRRERELAVENLIVLQVFEDIDSKLEGFPILAVVYDFSIGFGDAFHEFDVFS